MAVSNLRLSGINSGYDTEAMIEQMLSSYQSKIDSQNKKLTKLTWQQDAYRDIIDKLTTFKNKYFDILNKKSYIMSPNTFKNFTSTVSGKTLGDNAKGLRVSTTSSSSEGSYKVSVSQLASAAKASGKSVMPTNFKLDASKAAQTGKYTTDEDGNRTYEFSLDVKVGSVSKTVSFNAELSADKIGDDGSVDMDAFTDSLTSSLNDALKDAFGKTGGDSDNDGVIDDFISVSSSTGSSIIEFNVGGNAAVSVSEREGSFGMVKAQQVVSISPQSAVTGENTIAVEIDGKIKKVTFNGVSSTYFDSKDASGNESILAEYNALKEAAYRDAHNLSSTAVIDKDALDKFTYTSAQAANDRNTVLLQNALNEAFDEDGIVFGISDGNVAAMKVDGTAMSFTMTAVEGGTFGLSKGSASNKMSEKTTLEDMGIVANGDDGKYTFDINGKTIELGSDATIGSLIEAVNKSGAGVTMSFSNLTNTFELTANNMGSAEKIEFDPNNEVIKALGLADADFTEGKNAVINVNGTEIYHNSNSFTTDGTTFNFDENITIGEEYDIVISKSYDDVKQNIKDFVEDYNQLIDDVYGYIGTAPARDEKNNLYEPLTDAEKDEMDEKDIEKWETAAKQGVIYNDTTVSSIMSQIRTALYNSVTLDDGSKFGIYNMGIKTSSDYSDHGKLKIDEEKFDKAFEENADAITKLFTDPDTGIMGKVNKAIDNAVRTTGSVKGSLISKAGLKSGSSSTDNYIYRQMESIKKRISQLQDRYDSKEEYWWKVFTNLESVMGDFNNQSAYLSSYLGGFGNYQ